jgi:hypothetical protein
MIRYLFPILLLGCSNDNIDSIVNQPNSSSSSVSNSSSLTSSSFYSSSRSTSSSSLNNSTSSSSIGIDDPLKLLLNQFPVKTLPLDSSFTFTWYELGKWNSEVTYNFYLKHYDISSNENEGWVLIDSQKNISDWEFTSEGLKDNDRVAIKLEVIDQENQIDFDQTQFFDISDLSTSHRYSDIKPILEKYCGNCHLNGNTEGGLKFNNYEQLTEDINTPRYLQNRMSLIKDMPTEENENQPTDLERVKVRDWVLGGFPEF